MYKALIAEKDPVVRATVSHYLEEAGLDVVTTKNGREALGRCRNCAPDIVITGLHLEHGAQPKDSLIAKLQHEFPEVPILAISDSTDPRDDEFAEKLGVQSLFRKPLIAGLFIQNVEAILESRSKTWGAESATKSGPIEIAREVTNRKILSNTYDEPIRP